MQPDTNTYYGDDSNFIEPDFDLVEIARDNLFSANHRAAMIREHGYSQSEWLTVEELVHDTEDIYMQATLEAELN